MLRSHTQRIPDATGRGVWSTVCISVPCRVQAGTTCRLAPPAGWHHVQVGTTCRLAPRYFTARMQSLSAALLVAQPGRRRRRVRPASWLCTTACSP